MKIETDRLILRWARCDKDAILKEIDWLNDPAVVRYSEQRHKRHTFGSQYDYIRSFLGSDNMLWEVWVKSPGGGVFIGTVSVYVDKPNKSADMGIMIGDKRVWGHGYGLEAWKGVMQYVWDTTDVIQITAGCMITNIGMIKIMSNAGMGMRGEIKKKFFWCGEWRNAVYFGAFR